MDKHTAKMANVSPSKEKYESEELTRCLQGIKRWPEITELLSQEKVPGQQLREAFEVLCHVIQHVAHSLPEHNSTVLDIIQKLLKVHIGHIYHALNASNHSNIIMAALNLLVAMVTFSQQAAQDVLTAINFQHGPFSMLVNRTNLKAEDDVRCCCIRLAMSFLVSGGNRVIKQMLANKDFIKSFFPKLKHDRASSIKLILVTLIQYVVCNPLVNKTEKLHILNDYTLQQIAALYTWSDHNKVEDPTDGSLPSAEIRQLCHQFLLKVTCDLKHGINFFDHSLGLSGKNCNPVLLKFLLGLHNVTEDELVRELVVGILRTCPDLLNRYLISVKLSFQPRQSPVWLANIRLLEEIMTGMPVVPSGLQHSRNISSIQLVQRAVAVSIPSSVLTPVILSDALKHLSGIVTCRILDIIKLILSRVKALIHWLGEFENSVAITRLQQAVMKALPGVDIIVNLLHKSLGKSLDAGSHQSTETHITDLHIPDVKQVVASPDKLPQPMQEDILVVLLDVLCAYQQTIPLSLAHCNYDFSLLPYIIHHGNTHLFSLVYKKAITLLLAFPEGKLRGFKEVRGEEGSTVLLLLRQLTTAATSPDLHALRISLLNKFMKETGLFVKMDLEIGLWLDKLTSYGPDETSMIVNLFYKALTQAIRNPYPFTDRVIEAMNRVDTSQERHLSNNTVPDVLDVVQSMGAIDLDGTYREDLMIAESLTCSALLPSALQIFIQLQGQDQSSFGSYISSVVLSIVDRQLDPSSICYLLHEYTQAGGCAVQQHSGWQMVIQYYSLWLPSAYTDSTLYQDIGVKAADGEALRKLTNDWSYILHLSILHGVALTEPDVKLLLNQDVQEQLLMIRQLLMYIRTLYTAQLKKVSVILPSYLNSLKSILNHVHCEPQESNQQEKQSTQDNLSSLPKHEWWINVAELILQHAAFQIWLDPHKSHQGKNNLRSTAISGFLSCLNLIKKHLSCDELKLHLQALLRVAFQPFLETVQHKQKISKTKKLNDEFQLRVELFQQLCEYVDDAELCEAVQIVLHTLSSVEVHVDCALQQHLRQMLCCLLDKLSERQRDDETTAGMQTEKAVLGRFDVSVVVELACRLNCDQMIHSLSLLMKRDPRWTSIITREVLTTWLQNLSQVKSEVLAILMESSKIHFEWFEEWCKHCSRKQLTDGKDLLLPVLLSYSTHCTQTSGNPTMSILHGTYWRWLQDWVVHLQDESSQDESHLKMNLLSQLLMYTSCPDLVGLLQSLTKQRQQGHHAVYNSLQLKTCHFAMKRLCTKPDFNMSDTDNQRVLQEVLVSCLQSLVNIVKMQQENSTLFHFHLRTVLSIVKDGEELAFSVSSSLAQTWKGLVRNGLKHHFQSSDMLQLLTQLVKAIFCNEDSCLTSSKLLPLPIVYQIVLSHSQFLPTLLEEQGTDPVVKESLVVLMLTMVQLNPRCCHEAHYPVLVGAYNATLSTTDSTLLMLMHHYQRNNAVSTDYKMIAWGQRAVMQHQTLRALGKSLWQQPTMKEILQQFETDVMKDSACQFPLHRKLQAPYDPSVKDCSAELYDPCFLFPLFSYLLAPEFLVDCSLFIESNALFLTLAGLASFDVDMRRASYHVLALFLGHMEGARFRGRREVYYLLECLRNSVSESNMRLASVLVVFVAQAASLMLTPAHFMYPTMLQYLLIKPQLQVQVVPMFPRLFYSSTFKHDEECQWMMMLLHDGLRHSSDVRLYHHSSIFDTVMACYQSSLASKQFKLSVERLLKRASSIDERVLQSPAHARYDLERYGMTEMSYCTVLFGVSRALGTTASLVWDCALGLPLERPKSMITEGLMKLLGTK